MARKRKTKTETIAETLTRRAREAILEMGKVHLLAQPLDGRVARVMEKKGLVKPEPDTQNTWRLTAMGLRVADFLARRSRGEV